VAAGRPDAVFIGDGLFSNGGEVVKALRARFGSKVALVAGDSFQPPSVVLAAAGRAAVGMYTTTTAVAHEGLADAGRRFVRHFAKQHPGMSLPSALTRASVTRELRNLRMKNGVLGNFRFDRNGDITPASFTVFRITGGRKRDPQLTEDFTGSVVDRVVRVPPALARPGEGST
jgi:hypothetical protein